MKYVMLIYQGGASGSDPAAPESPNTCLAAAKPGTTDHRIRSCRVRARRWPVRRPPHREPVERRKPGKCRDPLVNAM